MPPWPNSILFRAFQFSDQATDSTGLRFASQADTFILIVQIDSRVHSALTPMRIGSKAAGA